MRRLSVLLLTLGILVGCASGVALEAQGPFSAQIQRALQAFTLQVTTTFTSGVTTEAGGLSVTGTGVTSGNVVAITGSSATPGASSAVVVNGSGIDVRGNLGSANSSIPPRTTLAYLQGLVNSSVLNSANATLRVQATAANTTNAARIWGAYIGVDDTIALNNQTVGIEAVVDSSTGNTPKTLYGVKGTTTTAAAVSAGTQTLYGLWGLATSNGLTGATAFVAAGYFQGGGTVASGTLDSYGIYVKNASAMSTTGTTSNTALYTEQPTGADVNWGANIGGDVAIRVQGTGLVLKATDGATCYRVTVNNAGTLAQGSVTCPP